MTTLPLLFAAVRAKLRRKPDRLLTAPSLARTTWRDLFPAEWPAFYIDSATAAGDRAWFERLRLQQERDALLGPGPKHADRDSLLRVRPGWIVADVTAEFAAITAQLRTVA